MTMLKGIKESARQFPTSGFIDLTPASFADNAAPGIIEVPAGCVLTGGFVIVTEAFDAATSSSLTIGDGTTADRFGTFDLAATGKTDLTIDGIEIAAQGDLIGTLAEVGGPSVAGKARVVYQYIRTGHSDYGQGRY